MYVNQHAILFDCAIVFLNAAPSTCCHSGCIDTLDTPDTLDVLRLA